MTLFKLIEARLLAGMFEGNMHICLRGEGRLAGGYLASGALTQSDIDDLESIASGLALNPCEAQSKWSKAVEYGRKEPLAGNESEYRIPIAQGHALEWDDEIGGDKLKIVGPRRIEEDEVSEPSDEGWDQVVDLTTYLNTLFNSEDQVGYVTESWYDQRSGRHLPQKGVWDRTSGQLIASLNNCKGDIGSVMGDVNPDGGAWIRFNPLNGKGVKDENVTQYKYALVESDEVPVPKQYALLKKLRLPIATLVHSGGKSLHAVVRIDAKDRKEYDQRVKLIYKFCDKNGLTVDTANKNPSRLSRMPGVVRNGNKQYLLDTNIGKPGWSEWKSWADERVEEKIEDSISEKEAGIWEEIQKYEREDKIKIFDLHNPPPKPVPIFTLAGTQIMTEGNIIVIVGRPKAGKTSFEAAMMASTFSAPSSDTLGVKSKNPEGGAVLLFDTEQSPYHFWETVAHAVKRAKADLAPDWLICRSIKMVPRWKRRDFLGVYLKRTYEKFGKIHSVFLDGLAHFVSSVNDEVECNEFVEEIRQYSIEYKTGIIGVIHYNPNSDKSRGHLGSELERECESYLEMEKNEQTGITTVFNRRGRRGDIKKDNAPRFRFCERTGMHVSTETKAFVKNRGLIQERTNLAMSLFEEKSDGMTWTELRDAIMEEKEVKKDAAKANINKLLSGGFIQKIDEGEYRLGAKLINETAI